MMPSSELIRSSPAHQKSVSCMLILSGSDDGTIAVTPMLMLLDSSIDTESKTVKRFVGHDLSVTGIATGMGRSYGIMISSSLDWTCKGWGVATGTHLQTVRVPGEIWSMVLDPSETELYAARTGGLIYKRKLKVETRK
ncbi:putative transcription factor WD40-like family [Helianthus anomalus]